jgi:5-methylcytosine-specific restriction endonuclease McrA
MGRTNEYRTSNRCRQLLRKQEHPVCCLCGNQAKLLVHHIDRDHSNDDFANLLIVCEECHKQIHTELSGQPEG